MWAIATNHGSYIGEVWEPGYHACSIFTKIQYLVSKQHILFTTEIKLVPTADNVFIQIDASIVFHLLKDRLYEFVYNLGPSQLED